VLENHSYPEIVGNKAAAAFNRLAGRGALLTRYYAVTHPSLPNYLALVSGSTQGITGDCTDCSVSAPNLVDALESAGRSWKTYAEGIPRPGWLGAESGSYAKKHVPFLYFRDVIDKRARLARIVGFDALRRDVASRRLPDFALVVPDLCHDLHDCDVATGDRWLGSFASSLLASGALGKGALFVVFDEGNFDDVAGGGGHVAAFAVGPAIRAGVRSRQATGHYGLLRTVEDALGLRALGRSQQVLPLRGIWH
jgi:phospholipase C